MTAAPLGTLPVALLCLCLLLWPETPPAYWPSEGDSFLETDRRAAQREARESLFLSALQWNAHGECFRDETCSRGAKDFLTGALQNATTTLDLAGVQGFNDPELHAGKEKLAEGWANVRHACVGAGGLSRYPSDSAVLFFDARRWEPLGSLRGGCFECLERHGSGKWVAGVPSEDAPGNYRAFLVQALRRRGAAETIVAVVSHHPHPPRDRDYDSKMALLKDAVGHVLAASSAQKLVLIADTNLGTETSNDRVIAGIYDQAQAEGVAGTQHHATCCAPDYSGVHEIGFDRIITAGFPGAEVETILPFGAGGHPPFAQHNMHDPIVGRIRHEAVHQAGQQAGEQAGEQAGQQASQQASQQAAGTDSGPLSLSVRVGVGWEGPTVGVVRNVRKLKSWGDESGSSKAVDEGPATW